MHILLVEPDKILARTYQESFKKNGHTTMWVTAAGDAIAGVDEKKPDCIILEVQLQGHNGIEFLFELRSYEDLRSIPVILHTIVPEHDLGLTEKTKEQLGISSYLYKPHTSLKTLQRHLENSYVK